MDDAINHRLPTQPREKSDRDQGRYFCCRSWYSTRQARSSVGTGRATLCATLCFPKSEPGDQGFGVASVPGRADQEGFLGAGQWLGSDRTAVVRAARVAQDRGTQCSFRETGNERSRASGQMRRSASSKNDCWVLRSRASEDARREGRAVGAGTRGSPRACRWKALPRVRASTRRFWTRCACWPYGVRETPGQCR